MATVTRRQVFGPVVADTASVLVHDDNGAFGLPGDPHFVIPFDEAPRRSPLVLAAHLYDLAVLQPDPVQRADAELEGAIRQARSAGSFNDADERSRRTDIAQARLAAARKEHDAAVAEFARLKGLVYG